jgi:hypothetical protein
METWRGVGVPINPAGRSGKKRESAVALMLLLRGILRRIHSGAKHLMASGAHVANSLKGDDYAGSQAYKKKEPWIP